MRFVLLFVLALLFQGIAMAQTKKVSGIVKDATGEPLIGVSVQVKGTSVGTLTDLNGSYSLDAPEGANTLVFTYIGMNTKEEAITGETLNTTLEDSSKALEEVVVVGYGTMKKRDLTGAVSSMKSSDLQSVASSNAMEAMQGKVAGMDITKSSGSAGSGLNISLRGNRSINAKNDPLIIVDGVDYGSTIDLNASDIESMEILKDASSTAIYGTRGANGVIIITTKRGKKGAGKEKTRVTYSGYVSANSPTKVPSTMSAEQDVNFLIERKRNADSKSTDPTLVAKSADRANYNAADVISGTTLDLFNSGTSVDWFDEVLNNSTTHNHELSVMGGGEKTSVNFSLGYLSEEGLMANDNMKRYNTKLTIDHIINPSLNVGASILYTKRDWNQREDNVFSQVLKMHSLADINEDIPSQLANSHTNPLINERDGFYENNTQQNRMLANAHINWELIKGLKFKTMFAADMTNTFKGIYEDYQITSRNQAGKDSYISQENTQKQNLTWDNTLNYSKEFNQKHDFQALLGQSVLINETMYGISSGTAGKEHITSTYWDLAPITAVEKLRNDYTKSNMLSYFGRLNYKYDEKYLFQATLRGDGSSVLAEGNKWGYFPSLSAAWRLTEEKFLKNKTDKINNIKLRYSWGVAGNAAVPAYGTLSTLTLSKVNYSFGDVNTFSLVPGNLGNEDLTWETTATHDIGLDFSFLRDRISGSVDFYYSQTDDLLLLKQLPLTSGYSVGWDNVGSTENKGIEVVLTTRNIDTKKFKWTSDWTFSMNRDKITALASGASQDISDVNQALVVGEAVQAFLDYETTGVWGTNEVEAAAAYGKAPGDLKIKDQNGDGVINKDDRILYNKSPKYILGWNNHFSYENFTLSVLTYARVGQWISYDLYNTFNPIVADGTPDLDYWTPENQSARFPRPGIANTAEYSSLNKVEATYWKIKDITLSYNINKKWSNKIGVSNAKVYGSMKNWFTFSNIDNYDPEQGGTVSNALMKQVVFGLNLEF